MKVRISKFVNILFLLIYLIASGCSNSTGEVVRKSNISTGDYVIYSNGGNTYIYDADKNEKFLLLNGEELTVDSTSFAYFDEKNKFLIFKSDYKCYIKDLNNMNNECIYLRSGSWEDFAIKDEIIVFISEGGNELSSNITVYNTKKKTKEDILDKNKCHVKFIMVSDSEIIYTYMDKYQGLSEINNNSVNNYTIGKYNFRTKEKIEKSKSKSMDVWTGTQLTRNGILLHEIDKEIEIKKVYATGLSSTHKGIIDKIGGFSRVYSFSFENGFELLNEIKMIPYELKGDKRVSHYFLPGSDSSNLKAYFDIPPLVCQDGDVVFDGFDGNGHSGRYYAESYSGELLYGREIITNDYYGNLDGGYCLNKSLAKKPICSFFLNKNYGAQYAVENKVYDGRICAVSSDGNRILVDEGNSLVGENKSSYIINLGNGEKEYIDYDHGHDNVFKFDDNDLIYSDTRGGNIVKNGKTICSRECKKIIFNEDCSIGVFLDEKGTLDIYKNNELSTVVGDAKNAIISNKDNVFYQNKNGELYYYKNGESIKIDDANLNSMLQYKILR